MKNNDADKVPLSLEERLVVQEFLMDAVIWGLHLDDKPKRLKMAAHLYGCVQASERHQSYPAHVLAALYQFADGLTEIDRLPDSIKKTLRPFVPRGGSPE